MNIRNAGSSALQLGVYKVILLCATTLSLKRSMNFIFQQKVTEARTTNRFEKQLEGFLFTDTDGVQELWVIQYHAPQLLLIVKAKC